MFTEKRRTKKMVVVLASLLLLAACSSNNGNNQQPSATAPATDAGSNLNEVAEESGDPVKIQIMANVLAADSPDNQKAFIDVINKKLNVELDFLAPPASGYEEQLQLTLVSGDLPDVVFFPSEQDEIFLNAVNDGALIPLNDYLEKSSNLMSYSYEHSWEALKTLRDGNVYGIPRTSITRYDGFFVRKDWMDSLGIEMPENNEFTVEQFTDLLRKFSFDDPDGNKQNDTYGYGTYLNASKVLEPVLVSELGHLGWQNYGAGEYTYTLPEYDRNSDIYPNILQYTRDAYKEGIIDPDSPINDIDAASDRFSRGITGVIRGFVGQVKSRQDKMQETNPNAELVYVTVKGPDGEVKGGVYGTGIWGVWAITSEAENPQKVVEVFDYLLSDEGWEMVSNGIENIHYKVEGGKKVYMEDASRGLYTLRSIVRRHDDPSFFMSPASYSQEAIKETLPAIQKSVDAAVASLDQGYTPPAARQPDYMDYKLTWDEMTTRIMLGELPLEQLDQIRDDWYKNGGEQYMQEMNAFIESIQ
ncbi:extracellular solute-binding protein [Paenibacillus sp. PAMC21692]|uniref:extracellular solute-binding protein n=1 Tax=Paenibacillus sp. PAMC21692 TaxID=2762320 RepID=UPI00164D4A7E|nr:extracellular solute-binding protein [Paenibacillus sp. PAMC21692]QNK58437.1 extracellular solute-binding protein [Paenibacillus sp. PAMC21692]